MTKPTKKTMDGRLMDMMDKLDAQDAARSDEKAMHFHVYNMAGVCVDCGWDADAMATDHKFCPDDATAAPPADDEEHTSLRGAEARLRDG